MQDELYIFHGPPLNNIVELDWLAIQCQIFFSSKSLIWRQCSSLLLTEGLVCRPGISIVASNIPAYKHNSHITAECVPSHLKNKNHNMSIIVHPQSSWTIYFYFETQNQAEPARIAQCIPCLCKYLF